MAKKKRKRKKDPHAHIDRLVAGGGATDPTSAAEKQAERRAAAAAAAAIEPSAARWLVGDGVGLDVVAELLGIPSGTGLQGRRGARLRELAEHVEQLVAAEAVCPSGTPLLDVLVADEDDRTALRPSLDLDAGLDALLAGDVPVATAADRSIRLAGAMMASADAHRAGAVDLAVAVAPPVPRHAVADELDALLSVLADRARWASNPVPAVALLDAGWLGASPLELFSVAAVGVAEGRVAEAVGEGLARWFAGWSRGPDPWRLQLLQRVDVDGDAILDEAATRAGSDHPTVIGGIVCELVGLRYPTS